MVSRVAVHIVVGLMAMTAGFAWAWSSPPGSSPDDDYHLASIWCPPPVQTSGCAWTMANDGTAEAVSVPYRVAWPACFAFLPAESARCTDSLTPGMTWTPRFDRGAYPGPYYHVMHLFTSDHVGRSVVVMRLFNVLLAIVLLGGASLASKPKLGPLAGIAVTASIVPLGCFILASTNPSSWAVTGIGAAALGLIAALTADSRRSKIAGSTIAIVGAVLASMARSDSGVFLGMVLFSVAVLYLEKLRRERWTWLVFAAIAAIAVWTYTHGAQTNVEGFGTHAHESNWSLLMHNLADIAAIPAGVFGYAWGLGWLDTRMPSLVSIPAMATVVVIATVSLTSMSVRKAIALCAPVAAAVGIPLVLLQRAGDAVGEDIQPRYLLSAVMLFVVILVLHASRERILRFTRGQALAVIAMLSLAQGLALFTNIRRYVTGDDIWSPNLQAVVEWWWPSGPGPTFTFVVGSLAFAGLLVLVWRHSLFPNGLRLGSRALVPALDAGSGSPEVEAGPQPPVSA